MNRLALDMVSLTVKMKELTGRLLEVKSVEEHWKDENFSLAANKAKLEERLRFLEAHVVEVRWMILMEKYILRVYLKKVHSLEIRLGYIDASNG
jgi:hypothetical protein